MIPLLSNLILSSMCTLQNLPMNERMKFLSSVVLHTHNAPEWPLTDKCFEGDH